MVPALAIHDTMKHIGSKVATVGFGACLGMTGFLMAVGTKVSTCCKHLISFRCILPEVQQWLPDTGCQKACGCVPCPFVHSGREVDDLLQGKRYMLQNTTMMMHHPSGVARGQASDINNEVNSLPHTVWIDAS